jgi:hypothetical protein
MQFGNNGYGKPALNILREVWVENCLTMHLKCMQTVGNSSTQLRRPFGTMEDASAVDLV